MFKTADQINTVANEYIQRDLAKNAKSNGWTDYGNKYQAQSGKPYYGSSNGNAKVAQEINEKMPKLIQALPLNWKPLSVISSAPSRFVIWKPQNKDLQFERQFIKQPTNLATNRVVSGYVRRYPNDFISTLKY